MVWEDGRQSILRWIYGGRHNALSMKCTELCHVIAHRIVFTMAKAQNYQINRTTWKVGISQNLSMTRPVLVWNLSQKWPWWQSQKPNKMHSHLQKMIQSSSNRHQQGNPILHYSYRKPTGYLVANLFLFHTGWVRSLLSYA